MNERLTSSTVGAIVAKDFRTAAVFDRLGIDFCCGGRRSLDDACRAVAADPEVVVRELDAVGTAGGWDEPMADWPVARLIDHIVATHHAYVRSSVASITACLTTLVNAYRVHDPELVRVRGLFESMGRELESHMIKEEQLLFPYIKDLAAGADTCVASASPFGTVANPIRMIEREHLEVIGDLRVLRSLTRDFSAPDDGAADYKTCMSAFARFDGDLRRHIHLENNILFPRALQLEEEIGGAV